jgi:TPR repeat protein
MKSFRQRVQSAAHHGLRWFVRLRMWMAVLFVVVFGVYELTRQYQTDLVSLPKVMQQDVSDWIDDAVMGKSYLEKPADELKAQADAGNAFAMYVYALRRTTRPPEEFRISPAASKVAQEYYEKAAQKGFVRAQAVVALYLQRGLGGTVDLAKAKAFAEKAAAKQDPLGMRILADILLDEAKATPGGNPATELKGCRLLIKAADRGNRGALRKLGDLTAEGRIGYTDERGDPILVQNFTQALAYYEQAALLRDYESCKLLALAYAENRIAPVDYVKAYAWNLVAAQLAPRGEAALKLKPDEVKKAQDQLVRTKDLADRMSPGDLTEAQNLARTLLSRIPTETEDAERSLLKAR